jgi:hypothetical protein
LNASTGTRWAVGALLRPEIGRLWENEAELGEFYMVYGRSIEPEWGLKTNKHAVGAPHWE